MAPTPVFFPGKSQGQRSLAGYSTWGRKESDMTEHARICTQSEHCCYLLYAGGKRRHIKVKTLAFEATQLVRQSKDLNPMV